jgi:hypothetical protein
MFLVNQRFLFRNFLLCCPSQRSARSHVPSQVATQQEIDRQLWAGGDAGFEPGTAGQQSGALSTILTPIFTSWFWISHNVTVPDSKSRNIPEVVVVRRGAGGVLGVQGGWVSWVKGGANVVSLQAT